MHKYRNVRQEITRIGSSSNVIAFGLLHLIAYLIDSIWSKGTQIKNYAHFLDGHVDCVINL